MTTTADAEPQAQLSFLPWVRQGAAAAIDRLDSLVPAQPGVATLAVQLQVNGKAVAAPSVQLRGPGDVVGIDIHQVIRTEPPAGTADFESNDFPSIEFDRPDFPWLFTPLASKDSKLRPWLCLVVVRKQPGVQLGSPVGSPLPTLTIAAPARHLDELPDLRDSWAWAHAQTVGQPADAQGALDGPPEQALSRLVCPRILAPETDYIACVVPTFELGRKAGLGLPIAAAEFESLVPAWPPTALSTPLQLPVYHSWQFRTGAGGDFASLAGRLTRQVPAGLGRRAVDIAHPGFAFTRPVAPADASAPLAVQMEGALLPLAADAAPVLWADAAAPNFEKALADILNQAAQQPAAQPLLAPPLYGRWHAGRSTAIAGQANWFDELNLDPRWRFAAGLGTRVVQQHQEALMASAWEQAAQVPQANQRLKRLQMSMAVNERLHARHLSALAPRPEAPDPGQVERMLRVAAPVLSRMRQPGVMAGLASADGSAPTLMAQLENSSLPASAVRVPMRRIGRQRGPLTRRVAAQGYARSGDNTWVARLNEGDSTAPQVPPPAADFARLAGLPSVDAVVGTPWNRGFQVSPENQPLPPLPAVDLLPAAWDWPGLFRSAAAEHLGRLRPPRPTTVEAHVTMQADIAAMLDQLHPRKALARLAAATVSRGSTALSPTAPGVAPLGVETVMTSPSFPQPMYESLKELSQELLLPGLAAIAPETVLGLRTNRAFVEAYMAGLSMEMGRELLWRGFPTDQQGTYFRSFWGSGTRRPDIGDLRAHNDRALGGAAPDGVPEEKFVFLLRSSLLRRYPNAVVYLTPAIAGDPPSPDLFPIFEGRLEPDVSFFGFDIAPAVASDKNAGYCVVIQEHPTEPRFGIDDGSQPAGTNHLAVGTALPKGVPHNPDYTWGASAAHIAGLTRRQPVRLLIHASELL